MNYTTITIAGSRLNTTQRDFAVKSGFSIMGANFSRSVKSAQLNVVLSQLVAYSIPFTLQTNPSAYKQSPCSGCRR
jgi:hypothetical protein